MKEENLSVLSLVAHELAHLEATWEKQMHSMVKIKGISAADIVDIVQEMTIVQGRLANVRWDLNNRMKKGKTI